MPPKTKLPSTDINGKDSSNNDDRSYSEGTTKEDEHGRLIAESAVVPNPVDPLTVMLQLMQTMHEDRKTSNGKICSLDSCSGSRTKPSPGQG